MNEPKDKIALIVNNHFDLMWRRCFRKQLQSGGKVYASYADIEANYILTNLELAEQEPDYCFQVESIAVLREFLCRYPENLSRLQVLCREGRFYLPGSGDNIIDTNLVLGESIVRNYLIGQTETEALFGYLPRVADRMDAFGNSAQLPQILQGFGLNYIEGILYTPCEAPVWRGLDGSEVTQLLTPVVGKGGHYAKYAPCARCGGTGTFEGNKCPCCEGRGIDRTADRKWQPIQVDDDKLAQTHTGRITAGDEELMPNPDTLEWYRCAGKKYNIRFANFEDLIADTERILDEKRAGGEQIISRQVELNPNNSGCWTNRIATKQNCRRQEYALLAAESLAAMAALSGKPYPHEKLGQTWRNLLFTMFHDAIAGTHVDAAYAELEEAWRDIDRDICRIHREALAGLTDSAEGLLTVYNPTGNTFRGIAKAEWDGQIAALVDMEGNPVPCDCRVKEGKTCIHLMAELPAWTAKEYRVVPGNPDEPERMEHLEQAVIENEYYRITADKHGLLEIFDTIAGVPLTAGEWRPFEFLLEHDEGSPWTTLSPNRDVRGLSAFICLTGVERNGARQTLTFRLEGVDSYALSAVAADFSVTLWRGLDRVDCEASVDWDDYSHQLQVVLPLAFQGKHRYEIPSGSLERPEYEAQTGWAAACGGWPALNWAGVFGKLADVLLNQGLPGYRMKETPMGTELRLSLLRSPTMPTYLHEPDSYCMRDWDGMRDGGRHSFRFGMAALRGNHRLAAAAAAGESFNAALLTCAGTFLMPKMPWLEKGMLRIAAFKQSENGERMILRVWNPTEAIQTDVLHLPAWAKTVGTADFMERPLSVFPDSGEAAIQLEPWKIQTYYFEYGAQKATEKET